MRIKPTTFNFNCSALRQLWVIKTFPSLLVLYWCQLARYESDPTPWPKAKKGGK